MFPHPHLHGGANLWTPPALGAALGGWWDGQDSSTITTATGVSQWSDKSGNGRHFTQATAAQQPTLVSSGIGGYPSLQFDGTDDLLRTASFTMAQSFSVLVVYRMTLITQFNTLVSFDPVNESAQCLIIPANNYMSPSNASLFAGSYAKFGSPGLNTDQFIAGVFNGASSVGSQNGNAATINPGTTGISTGIGLSSNFSSGTQFKGLVGEMIFVSGAMTVANRQKAEGYLAWKWGTQGGLPAGHPYKSFPPTP